MPQQAAKAVLSMAKSLRVARKIMAVVLLVLFPVLLMYRPRYALVAMVVAIVLLYRGRVKSATSRARRRVDDEMHSSNYV